jgi:hypothetical protein
MSRRRYGEDESLDPEAMLAEDAENDRTCVDPDLNGKNGNRPRRAARNLSRRLAEGFGLLRMGGDW